MVGVTSKALSKGLGYMEQKAILQERSGTQRLLSWLLYQCDNIHLQDDIAEDKASSIP
jgi:hypothetical protein